MHIYTPLVMFPCSVYWLHTKLRNVMECYGRKFTHLGSNLHLQIYSTNIQGHHQSSDSDCFVSNHTFLLRMNLSVDCVCKTKLALKNHSPLFCKQIIILSVFKSSVSICTITTAECTITPFSAIKDKWLSLWKHLRESLYHFFA